MNAFHHSAINTSRDFLETLKAGPFAWPGGYPIFFIMSDGEPLSFNSAKTNAMLIARSICHKARDGWRVVACDVNYEDGSLFCCHSGERIEAAYV